MRAYQWTIRPVIGANCRFWPSCSDYAIEAFRAHGALRGSGLAARRILRCNPWCDGGYDPVPPPARPQAGTQAGHRAGGRQHEGLMDQKRLILAIALSIAILLGFQFLVAPHLPHPPAPPPAPVASHQAAPGAAPGRPRHRPARSPRAAPAGATSAPKNVPRVKIAAPQRVRLDQLARRADRRPDTERLPRNARPERAACAIAGPAVHDHALLHTVRLGGRAGQQVKVPDNDTVWRASADTLGPGHPMTLSWDNGQGLTFQLLLTVDDDYMFGVTQSVKNATGQPVTLYPWARVRRDYTPKNEGFTSLYGGVSQGLTGVTKSTLHSMTYATAKSKGKKADGVAYDETSTGGWGGITDKYWLTALVPEQSLLARLTFRYIDEGDGAYQVGFIAQDPATVAPGAAASLRWHAFAGAKELTLLDRYQAQYQIPNFGKAVDFGWFYLLARPIFYCLDWLNNLLGNFGLAIIAFTTCVKILFFPLANYSYRSMSKMKLLGPKMQALRERLKDDPQKLQQEMMGMYRAEKVNPASRLPADDSADSGVHLAL